jgi:hypothetical protein
MKKLGNDVVHQISLRVAGVPAETYTAERLHSRMQHTSHQSDAQWDVIEETLNPYFKSDYSSRKYLILISNQITVEKKYLMSITHQK